MTTLALNNVSKSYDAENVLSDVNFEVADGEMIVIVGPSGCGKSSLLRMVAGLEPITAGEVLINGQVVNKVEPKDRDIAMVFQNYALYPHMTVFANMAYGLKLRGLSVDAIKKRVTETALLLGLEICWRESLRHFPVDSANELRWGEPSFASLPSFCLMSRYLT